MKTLANNTAERMNAATMTTSNNDTRTAAEIISEQKKFFAALARRIEAGRAQEKPFLSGKKVVRVYRIMTVTATFEDGRAVSHSWAVGVAGVYYYKMTEKDTDGRRRTVATSTREEWRDAVARRIMTLRETARRAGAVFTWTSEAPTEGRRVLSLPDIDTAADMVDRRRRAAALVTANESTTKEVTAQDIANNCRPIINGVEYMVFFHSPMYCKGEVTISAGGRTIYRDTFEPCDARTARAAAAAFLNESARRAADIEAAAAADTMAEKESTDETPAAPSEIVVKLCERIHNDTAAPVSVGDRVYYNKFKGEKPAPAVVVSYDENIKMYFIKTDDGRDIATGRDGLATAGDFCPITGETLANDGEHLTPAEILTAAATERHRIEREKAAKVAAAPADVLADMYGDKMTRADILAHLLTISTEHARELLAEIANESTNETPAAPHYSTAAKVGKAAAAVLVLLSLNIGAGQPAQIYTDSPADVLAQVAEAGETVTAYTIAEA